MDEDDTNEAPYVAYGTRLEPLEDDAPSKKPLRVEEQIVTDKQGRRRFHGAFTGGFSAGYYNTVGSERGWTPAAFVSSRGQKLQQDQQQQRPEDFMDEDDLEEFGIAPRQMKTTRDFAGQRESRKRGVVDGGGVIPGAAPLQSLIIPANVPVGVRLLRRMGWRDGQGIGPRVKKKSRKTQSSGARSYGCSLPGSDHGGQSSSEDEAYVSKFTFAPKDIGSFEFAPKDDFHGIGYRGIDSSISILGNAGEGGKRDYSVFDQRSSSGKVGMRGQAFGTGAMEDEDPDIYTVDHMSNYNMEIGGDPDRSKDNFGWTGHRKGPSSSRVDAVGKVLEGFHLASEVLNKQKVYEAPRLPAGYKPTPRFAAGAGAAASGQVLPPDEFRSSRFTLSAAQRGSMLGEQPLPGPSSAFELMSEDDRKRIADITSRAQQQPGQRPPPGPSPGQRPPPGPSPGQRSPFGSSPGLQPTAQPAKAFPRLPTFQRSSGQSGSFKPFASDPDKQSRYELYLEKRKAGTRDGPEYVGSEGMTEWEQNHEREEFQRSASLYQPLAGVMASRFTSAKFSDDPTNTVDLPAEQKDDRSEQLKAAELKMFGKLTRESFEWHPDRLLCKRFNIPDPYPGSTIVGLPHIKKRVFSVFNFLNAGNEEKQPSQQAAGGGSLRKQAADDGRQLDAQKSTPALAILGKTPLSHALPSKTSVAETKEDENEDSDKEDRPPMDLFKAIFQDSDDEEESDSTSESSEEEKEKEEMPVEKPSAAPLRPIEPSANHGADSHPPTHQTDRGAGEVGGAKVSSLTGTAADLAQHLGFLGGGEKREEEQREEKGQQQYFGPALPPPGGANPAAAADGTSGRRPGGDLPGSTPARQGKHRRKEKHKKKHRKEKLKKKKTKSKHKKKQKRQKPSRRKEESTSESDSDTDEVNKSQSDDDSVVDNNELLKRIKSLPTKHRLTAAEFF